MNKDKYDDTPPPNSAPTASQCSTKEQNKCCNYQGTLKEAAKYCQSLECDIADCNKPSGGYSNYIGGYPNYNNYQNDGPNYNIDVRNDGFVTYGDGDRPQGNKGPREDAVDYVSNQDGDRPQGNKGPREDTADNNKDEGDNFLKQGVNENCTREYTAGGACREVCTAKVEYKLMGIVMSTHDETTTRPCS